MPFYESQPVIYPLHRLLEETLRGEIRVPRFQRPGTEISWGPDQRGDLLDSIFRGYPIGTLLLWSTNEPIQTLDCVGGAAIPVADGGQRHRLVLDGHQRLSTLVALLGPALGGFVRNPEWTLDECWVFDPEGGEEAKPSRDRFVLLKGADDPGNNQLPLDIALDRVRLNAWVRERETLTPDEVRLVDALRDRLREYSIPVATLVAEELDEATESFKRINSSGTPMSPFHMVTALAYTSGFDPQERFQLVRAELLEQAEWEEVDDADLLRVCAGLARRRLRDNSQHPAKIAIDRLAASLRHEPDLIERAGEAVVEAARVLKGAGVHGPRVLPYSWQLMVIAIEVGARDDVRFEAAEEPQVCRWFWLTTYGGVFAGANSAVVDRAAKALSDLLAGGDAGEMQRDSTPRVEEPKRFDFRSARSRACLLQMARIGDNDHIDGHMHHALAQGSSSVQTLYAKLGRSTWYNVFIEPEQGDIVKVREALRLRARGRFHEGGVALLHRLGIEPTDAGTVDELLERRRERLMAAEKAFVQTLGLTWR